MINEPFFISDNVCHMNERCIFYKFIKGLY